MRIGLALALLAVLACGCSRDKPRSREANSKAGAPTVPADAGPASSFPRVDADLAAYDAEVKRRNSSFRPTETATPAEAVQQELAHMFAIDQYMRKQVDLPHRRGYDEAETFYFRLQFSPRWDEIDLANTKRVKQFIDEHGWLTISRFGPQADQQAWLLVQHADRDVEFQKRVLALLEPLVAKGETEPSHFAYLYDRVASGEGRPQRYGTQGRCVGPGKWEPDALENPAEVDALRATVGLAPLATYKQDFVDICH